MQVLASALPHTSSGPACHICRLKFIWGRVWWPTHLPFDPPSPEVCEENHHYKYRESRPCQLCKERHCCEPLESLTEEMLRYGVISENISGDRPQYPYGQQCQQGYYHGRGCESVVPRTRSNGGGPQAAPAHMAPGVIMEGIVDRLRCEWQRAT